MSTRIEIRFHIHFVKNLISQDKPQKSMRSCGIYSFLRNHFINIRKHFIHIYTYKYLCICLFNTYIYHIHIFYYVSIFLFMYMEPSGFGLGFALDVSGWGGLELRKILMWSFPSIGGSKKRAQCTVTLIRGTSKNCSQFWETPCSYAVSDTVGT